MVWWREWMATNGHWMEVGRRSDKSWTDVGQNSKTQDGRAQDTGRQGARRWDDITVGCMTTRRRMEESSTDVRRTSDKKLDVNGATDGTSDAMALQSSSVAMVDVMQQPHCCEACVSFVAMVGGNVKNVAVHLRMLWCYKLQQHCSSERCGVANHNGATSSWRCCSSCDCKLLAALQLAWLQVLSDARACVVASFWLCYSLRRCSVVMASNDGEWNFLVLFFFLLDNFKGLQPPFLRARKKEKKNEKKKKKKNL
jgi:hypothetical protein